MTKKTASRSGRTPLSLFYRSPRLMVGLSLISGFSILSSSLVIAQTDSHVDTASKPPSTAVKAAPAPAPEPPAEHKQVVSTIVVPVTPQSRANREYTASAPPPAPVAAKKPVPSRTSQTALRKPSTLQRTSETTQRKPSASRRQPETARRERTTPRGTSETASKKPSTPRDTSETALKKPSTPRDTSETALKKPSTPRDTSETAFKKPATLQRTASALGPAITVSNKPTLAAPDLSISDAEAVAKPPKVELNAAQNQESAQAPESPTNRSIDRTENSIGATDRDEAPASVILTDRSTNCKTVSRNGQLVSGSCGVAAPSQPIATRRTARQDIANNAEANREIPIRQTNGQQRDNSGRTVEEPHLAKITAQEPRLGRAIIQEPRLVRMQDSRLHRVIIQEPQLAEAITNEPELTGVKRLPKASITATEPVKIGPVRLRSVGIRRAQSRAYFASSPRPVDLLPVQGFPVSEDSASQSSLAYYNQTPRPTGRPNTTNAKFMFPLALPGAVTSLFGWRIHPITGDYRFHAGTDMSVPAGTPVLAAIAGQVITADFMGGYGLTVVVQHEDGTDLSLYGHLSEIFVQPGDRVEQGNVLGRVGSTGLSTGPHLHFEWRHLTSDGWVALDATPNIEYAMAQFVKSLQVAQVPPQPEPVSQQPVSQTAPQSTPQAVSPATAQVIPQSIPQAAVQTSPQQISLRGL